MSQPVRAEHVGSLLRPPELLAARAGFKASTGRKDAALSGPDLAGLEDRAALEAIALQRDTGIGVFTDGEVRRDTWMASLRESIGGMVATTHLTGGQTAPWHRAGGAPPEEETSVDTVAAAQKVWRNDNRTLVEAEFLRAHAPGPFKVTMISASMGTTVWHPEVSKAAYPTPADLIADLVDLQVAETAELIDAGTCWIQLDSLGYTRVIDAKFRASAMEGANSPALLLDRTLTADAAIVAGIRRKDPSVTIGMHICRGNNRSAWMLEGSYEPIAERLFGELAVDRFLLEYDTERAGGFAPLRFIPEGRLVVLGLVSSKVPELESLDDLMRRVEEAARYVAPEYLAISPQCGFASTSAGNLLTVDEQKRKLELVVAAAQRIWG
jgi:5-methyltetrahydropteroyltriglutamate--homocysteine methyltransferase